MIIKKRKKPVFIESLHQMAIINYARNKNLHNGHMLIDYLIKIHNEGRKNIVSASIDKKLGLKAGVSDLFLAIPTKEYSGMWIEVKRKGGKLTKNQHAWFDKMQLMNYYTCVVYDVHDFDKEVNKYLFCYIADNRDKSLRKINEHN